MFLLVFLLLYLAVGAIVAVLALTISPVQIADLEYSTILLLFGIFVVLWPTALSHLSHYIRKRWAAWTAN